ncbi:ATP-dependent zinc protease [Aeromonas cavernicola]|uniref:ATP-dependent zinc protease n=1 Tax=Aeromonas cavernicola TaxID=1006623 RepID=A0A2H9U2I4_9GAMM|nr:RimK/LysX family protein [Aeromonas cavernicola]PJG58267.1 ATP-dependent zinc protease [Aeromonas cavernicola]
MLIRLVLALLLVASGQLWAAASYGWVEKGLILPTGVAVKMKLDTGALTSSLDARAITLFKREGKPWVSFLFKATDANSGKTVSQRFERPVERSVTIRGAGGIEQRPIVTLSICLGDQVYQEWFTLRDRSKMIYPVLLGRRLLADLGPVDASRTFTVQPRCR